MAGISETNITNWVKVRYIDTPNELNDMLYDGGSSAFWQSIKGNAKMTEGKDWTTPLRGGQKRTAGSDSAVTWQRTKSGATAPRVTFKHKLFYDFNYVAIDRPAMLSTKTMAGTFANTLKDEINQAVMDMALDGASAAFVGMAKGSIGMVASISGKVITMDPDTIMHRFQPGQYVEFAAAAYNGSTDSRRTISGAKVFRIGKVDLQAKTITTDVDTSAQVAANDLVFKEGDYLKISNGTNHLMGNADYSPASIAAADSFLGTNRSINPQRLAGFHYKAAAPATGVKKGDHIHNCILWARTQIQRHFPGYRVTKVYANPVIQYHLETADRYKGAVRYLESPKEQMKYGCLGFDAFYLLGAAVHGGKGKSMGKVPIVFDPIVPDTQVHLICEPAWELRYLSEKQGSIIAFKTEQGNRLFLDRAGENISLLQLEAYYFFVNKLPGASGLINLAAVNVHQF